MSSDAGGSSPLARAIFRTGSILAILAGSGSSFLLGLPFAVSLTASALVVIVHLLWLDRLLAVVLVGDSPRLHPGDRFKILGHILVLTALVGGACLWRDFSPAGAAAGVTTAIVAVVVEGWRTSTPTGS